MTLTALWFDQSGNGNHARIPDRAPLRVDAMLLVADDGRELEVPLVDGTFDEAVLVDFARGGNVVMRALALHS